MKCKRCNLNNDSEFVFCTQCGFKLSESYTDEDFKDNFFNDSEIHFQGVFFNLTDALIVCRLIYDKNNKPKNYEFLDVNPAFLRIYDTKKINIIGKLATEFFKSDSPLNLKIFEDVLNTNSPQIFEISYKPKKILLKVTAYKIEEDIFACIYKDVTRIRNLEQKIITKNKELQLIYDNMDDGIIIADCNTRRIVHTSPPAQSMFGYTEEELQQMKIDNIHPKENLAEIIKLFNFSEEKIHYNLPCQKKDGTIFFVDIIRKKITYNNHICWVGFFSNVTSEVKLEKMRDLFLLSLSKELKAPLTAEENLFQNLLNAEYGELTENQKIATQNMLSSNKDLLNMITKLLEVYQNEANQMTLNIQEIDITLLLKDILNEISPLFKEKSKCYTLKAPKDKVLVNIDKFQIKRVLINLLANAIDFSKKLCEISIEKDSQAKKIIIKVSDDGEGLPEDQLSKIFDLYYSSSKKFRKVGTGLGLFLSKKIVESHQGKIYAKSDGKTYFTIIVELKE